MKRVLIIFFSALISINAVSQHTQYRKDDHPQNIKEDRHNEYQVNAISNTDILKALEIAGVRIFDIPITPAFEREYSISLKLDEYKNGIKIDSKELLNHPVFRRNTYTHFIYDSIEQKDVPYFDYISRLIIFSKDSDRDTHLTISHLGGSTKTELKKQKKRKWQSYHWRAYSVKDWKLDEEIPLLVFASTWYDKSIKTDRFCGVVDLSLSVERTKELFDKSPHYYVISLKVYE